MSDGISKLIITFICRHSHTHTHTDMHETMTHNFWNFHPQLCTLQLSEASIQDGVEANVGGAVA